MGHPGLIQGRSCGISPLKPKDGLNGPPRPDTKTKLWNIPTQAKGRLEWATRPGGLRGTPGADGASGAVACTKFAGG
jgi:hypothetical protein